MVEIEFMSDTATRYGVVVGLVKGTEIYLSRRIDDKKFAFPKKWQFLNGYLKETLEISIEAAHRTVLEETGINIHKNRFYFLNSITVGKEFYYIYLVHLKDDETPIEIDEKVFGHSNWKAFPLDKAVVLDLVPCLRTILRKLLKTLAIAERGKMKETQKIGYYPAEGVNGAEDQGVSL